MGNSHPESGGTASSVTSVGCDVANCKYQDAVGGYCTAAHISVQNKSAINKGETYCNTFSAKGSY